MAPYRVTVTTTVEIVVMANDEDHARDEAYDEVGDSIVLEDAIVRDIVTEDVERLRR